MMQRVTSLLILAFALLWAAPAVAAKGMSCKNPRVATESAFTWQQPKRRDPFKAAACLDRKRRSQAQLNESLPDIVLEKPGDPVRRPPLEAARMGDIVDGFGPKGSSARPEGPEITKSKHVPMSPSASDSDPE